MSEAEICTAAFFRTIGKDVATKKEFTMTVSLNLRWISVKDAPKLLGYLERSGCVSVKGDYVRPAEDLSAQKVPVTYKPSAELCNAAISMAPEAAQPKPAATDATDDRDMFSEMLSAAADVGISAKEFMAESRRLSKTLGITQTAAGFVLLSGKTHDASRFYEDVKAGICSK